MKTLFALAALAVALPAGAQQDFAAEATKNWNENILPGEAINWVKFRGEDGIERTLWYFYKDLPSTKTWKASVPLFVLDANPAVEARMMRSQTGFYPDKFEDLKVSLAIFKKNQVSPYYLAEWDDSNFWIGRRDRAETRLRGDRPGLWYLYSGIVTNQSTNKYASVNGVVPWARVQVYKPEGPGLTASSPLTAYPPYESWCTGIASAWKNGPEPSQQLSRGFTPHDVLLWQSSLQPGVSAPGIWNALYEQGKAGIAKGDFTKAAEYIDWYRKQAAAAVETTGAASAERAKRADATFSPAESKYLVCRMRHAGKEDEFMKKIEKLTADSTKTFVAAWRQFALNELKTYLDESKTAPRLPRLAEHDALSDALVARTEKALSGAVEAPSAATRPKTAAKPKKQTASLPDAEDVFK